MKKVVAFLLCVLIFVAPVTTLVKADVVIGDNDQTIVNENATILGRKLALMESFSDLALSGVTEFTISNTNDVDSYLDYLWGEIGDAIDSLSDGTGFTEISNNLKSKYFYNLINYRDYITNRGNYLAQLLQNPSTTLLSTYFADNVFGKIETSHYDLALDMFKSLSQLNNETDYDYPSEYQQFVENITNFTENNIDLLSLPNIQVGSRIYIWNNRYDYSYSKRGNSATWLNRSQSENWSSLTLTDIYINGNDSDGYIANWTLNYVSAFGEEYSNSPAYNTYYTGAYSVQYNSSYNGLTFYGTNQGTPISNNYSSGSLLTLFNYLNQHFRHCNIYVNGDLWGLASGHIPINPSLDIDGFLKLYGNDNPQQYELQPNTQIDYDQLYQVIYNAIRDNLPISQGDINYYDSHDTIYSPTIINNYGDEEGDESDLIDTILDYAVIPKFDTAIAQPMRQALTDGVVIMNNSITNVIPNEILLILGACFFLLLFAVVINRMIK